MKVLHGLVAALVMLGVTTTAEADPADIASDDPYRIVYAKRQMSRLDSNGDGRFEEVEDEQQWKQKRGFDSNGDGILTLDELAKEEIRYLNSSGQRTLNVLFKKTTEEDLYLDVYYPSEPTSQKLPTVIYVHGGGWASGSKQGIAVGAHRDLYLKLLERGFCVVAVNYRLCKKVGTVAMRDCVVDAKDAVRYLARHSDALGVDPQRFFIQGDSAGGQIAQVLLLSSPESLPGDPTLAGYNYTMLAGVSWYGPCDFERTELFNHDGRSDFVDRFGARILKNDSRPSDKSRLYQEMSPVNYLRADNPPLLLIQGDQDTTIPVHHAHYMKERADAVGATVEVMIVRNAGHNWRNVGAPINPSKEAIVEKTVDFLAVHLKDSPPAPTPSDQARTANGKMPEFSWDTLPLYIHVRKTDAFTPQELTHLASFPLITFEKTTGSEAYGSTDAGTIQAAEAIKRINPSAKVLFYRNVLIHYGGYSFDRQLDAIANPFLVDKDGNDKLIRGRVRAYDLSDERVRKWWVDSMASVCNQDSIDGLFLDGNVKVLTNYLQRELPDGRKEQVVQSFDQMMEETRDAIGDQKLMIANILRARFVHGGLEFMNHFDGSYLEGFEHEVGGVSKADYIAKGIETVQKAARDGKVIALSLNIADSSIDEGVDELRGNLQDFASIDQARVDYCIALFLVMMERYSYLSIHDGYDVNSNDKQECASKLWMKSLPEYKRPLGAPKGPATRNGYQYTREFEHASVMLDIEAGKGVVQWKSKH